MASVDDNLDPSSYVARLRDSMRTLRATPTRQSTQHTAHVSTALSDASHVFVRHDAVKKPLQQPYDGLYKVLKRSSKFFTLDLNGRHDTVSVDRLKPAFLDIPASTPTAVPPPTPPPTPPVTRTTRSGRRVHWPTHLTEFVP